MSPNDMPRNLSLEDMDKQSLLHPYTSIANHLRDGPVVIAGARGAHVHDIHGKRYIRCHGRPVVRQYWLWPR